MVTQAQLIEVPVLCVEVIIEMDIKQAYLRMVSLLRSFGILTTAPEGRARSARFWKSYSSVANALAPILGYLLTISLRCLKEGRAP